MLIIRDRIYMQIGIFSGKFSRCAHVRTSQECAVTFQKLGLISAYFAVSNNKCILIYTLHILLISICKLRFAILGDFCIFQEKLNIYKNSIFPL